MNWKSFSFNEEEQMDRVGDKLIPLFGEYSHIVKDKGKRLWRDGLSEAHGS